MLAQQTNRRCHRISFFSLILPPSSLEPIASLNALLLETDERVEHFRHLRTLIRTDPQSISCSI